MTKELKAKELEQVNGGTVEELADIMSAFSSGNEIARNSAYVPGVNAAAAYEMRRQLKNDYGIKADISIGIGGTDYCSDPNEYTEIATGRSMSHIEVLSVIQADS